MIRRTSIFRGHVQGVGFRFTTQSIARSFRVSGYVRNLPDGRVELVGEGETEEIARFLETIEQQMGGFIRFRSDNDSPATGEFSDFDVRR